MSVAPFASVFAIFALAGCDALARGQEQVYSLTDLGYLPSDNPRSEAYGINLSGQAVGESLHSRTFEAFLWSRSTGMVGLGVLTPGLSGTHAYAINDSGDVVGVGAILEGNRAFLWRPDTGMQVLGPLPGVVGFSAAWDINNSGMVVGNVHSHAVRWWNGTVLDLGSLGGSPYAVAIARAINQRGVIVGDSTTTMGPGHAFIWSEEFGMRDLGAALGPDISSVAMAINDAGDVVGTYWHWPYSTGSRAVLWRATGEITDLAMLPGEFESSATAINNSGTIVGYTNSKAVIWTQPSAVRALQTMVDASGAGWNLAQAFDINDRGEIVVTAGRGVLLTPRCNGGPLAITQQPSASRVHVGAGVSLSIQFAGVPEQVRWQKNGVPISDGPNISGATTATLTIGSLQPSDQGDFTCTISHPCGLATSDAATLSCRAGISEQPPVRTYLIPELQIGATVVNTDGATFRWRLNGRALPTTSAFYAGVTGPVLTVRTADFAFAGVYDLAVTNVCGTTISEACEVRCPADFNNDGGIDGADVASFFAAWEGGDVMADVNGDGGIDGADVESFFGRWEAGNC